MSDGNIQQRVWDAFPPYPQAITFSSLCAALPFASASVYQGVRGLVQRKLIERNPGSRKSVYRRRKGAQRPIDMRGHHGASGRPRADK